MMEEVMREEGWIGNHLLKHLNFPEKEEIAAILINYISSLNNGKDASEKCCDEIGFLSFS